ncbi:MAG: hypothetical protein MZV64_37140 [Ignavibacteriales bacterium]|nr:hypothetical protein [Ignavibacteriales bacterium]
MHGVRGIRKRHLEVAKVERDAGSLSSMPWDPRQPSRHPFRLQDGRSEDAGWS